MLILMGRSKSPRVTAFTAQRDCANTDNLNMYALESNGTHQLIGQSDQGV